MSSAAVLLAVSGAAAVIGSLLVWAFGRARRPAPADFHDQLRAIAPQRSSGATPQPSGIVRLDTPSPSAGEESTPGT